MPIRDKRRSRLLPILFTIVILLGLLYYLIGIPLNNAEEAWQKGENQQALQTLRSWSRLHLRPADYDNLFAVIYLTMGARSQAAPYLHDLAGRSPELFPVVDKIDVAKRLVSVGNYQGFLEYDTAVRARFPSDGLPLYRAAAQLGIGRIQEARTTFATVSPGTDPELYKRLEQAIEQRKSGTVPLVLDREGNNHRRMADRQS